MSTAKQTKGAHIAGANANTTPNGVGLGVVAFILVLVSSVAPLTLAVAMIDAPTSAALVWYVFGLAIAAVLSAAASWALTHKIKEVSQLLVRLTQLRNVEDILALERQIQAIGGSREVRHVAFSVRKISHALIRASRKPKA